MRAASSRGCLEYLETPNPNPPRTLALATVPAGIAVIPISLIVDFHPQSSARRLGSRRVESRPTSLAQNRRNALRPELNSSRASFSLYSVTLGGEIQPIQCLARCHARIAAGSFTLIEPSLSIIFPPPSSTCHSRALQVSDSAAAPGHM